MSEPTSSGRALVVADGRLDEAQLRHEAGRSDTFVIGADGGAARAHDADVRVDIVVGDLDSIDPAVLVRLATAGTEIRRASPDKDQSDTELAILAALERGSGPIAVLGALGGARIDHALANVLLLAHPRLDGHDVAILDGGTRIRCAGTDTGPGTVVLTGERGDLVTLLAIAGPVEGVTTHDLRYPLHAETLIPGPARGLSNELLGATASVTTERGRLLVIHTRRSTLEDSP